MKYQEFIDQFKRQAYSLSHDKQLTFAISINKMLYIDYQDFHNEHGWGDPNVLMEAIQMCEQAQTAVPAKEGIELMLSKVEAITPDTENFGDEIGSCGLNACISVVYTLQFLLDKDPLNIFYIGTALTDTIDLKVQKSIVLSDEEIDEHPLMQEARMFLLEQTSKNR